MAHDWLAERIALAPAALVGILFVIQAIFAWQTVDFRREAGWQASWTSRGWLVTTVVAASPVADRLLPGDRIVAMDGDSTASATGPRWLLGPHTAGTDHVVTVSRTGATSVDVRFPVLRLRDTSFRPWAALYLLVALVYLIVGVILAWHRPRDDTLRFGYFSCLAIAMVMLHFTSRHYDAALSGAPLVVSQLLLAPYPLHFLLGFFFLAGFPSGIRPGGWWRRTELTLVTGCLLAWVGRVAQCTIVAARADGVRFITAHPVIAVVIDRVLQPAEGVLVLAVCGASLAVSVHNYRRTDEVQRRRLRWIALGLSAAVLPITIVQVAAIALGRLESSGDQPALLILTRQVANAFVVIQPIAMGYAVLRHRVLGLHVAIRLGVQYLLARSVLQIALLLPLLAIVARGIANPNASVSGLILGSGRWQSAGLLVGSIAILYFRRRLRVWIDRRFFREAYDRELVLIALVDQIPRSESIEALCHLVAGQLEGAMHVTEAQLYFLEDVSRSFVRVLLADVAESNVDLDPDGQLVLSVQREGIVSASSASGTHAERRWLEQLRADVIVKIPGIDDRLRGVLVLGAKRSEEPFTYKDRALLRTIAAQIGSVHEVLALREAVNREKRVRREVLARFREADLELLVECRQCGRCFDRDVAQCPDDGTAVELTLPIPPTIDGKYQLERRIGRGGMGAVYRAMDVRLRRHVAIKVMLGHMFGSSRAQRRFDIEARASARLDHPNIVRIYDNGLLSAGGAYLVLELVAGPSWRELLNEAGVLSPPRLAGLLGQLCDGVDAAHSADVIHRDLKPENLLIAGGIARDRVKILDFGVAKMLTDPDGTGGPLTGTGVLAGTRGYAAPELFSGGSVGVRSDIFSVGVIAIESLSRSPIRPGDLDLAGLRAVVDDLSEHPELLRVALLRCIEANPSERFTHIGEARSALVNALLAIPS
ncbi:MAG: protein kinase [Gemmatimonadaceae bacterium]